MLTKDILLLFSCFTVSTYQKDRCNKKYRVAQLSLFQELEILDICTTVKRMWSNNTRNMKIKGGGQI